MFWCGITRTSNAIRGWPRPIRRYYHLILDDHRQSYQHVMSPTPVKSRYRVPLDYVSTSISGRALVEIIKPGADCYRWKDRKPAAKRDKPAAGGTIEGRHYRMKATIQSPERYKNVPYSIEIDFGKLLQDQKVKGTFDRFSVIVKGVDSKSGGLHDVHYNLSP